MPGRRSGPGAKAAASLIAAEPLAHSRHFLSAATDAPSNDGLDRLPLPYTARALAFYIYYVSSMSSDVVLSPSLLCGGLFFELDHIAFGCASWTPEMTKGAEAPLSHPIQAQA